jgi:integrase/recombinase XerD
MDMGRPSNIVVINQDFRKLAEEYHAYLSRLGYNKKSNKARFNYLNEFLSWLEQQGFSDVKKVTAKEVNDYYIYISNRPSKTTGGTLNLKTTHTHFIIIRDLFTMLQEENKIEVNPCNSLKYPYPTPSEERIILTQNEIQELYKATKTAQERAILSLAYGCGFRCGEIVLCNIEDVRLREKIIIIPKGKGNKRRVVPLSNGVIKDLADYYYKEREELTKGRDYELNPISNQQAFMLHSRGGRIRQHSCNKYLRQIIERTENKTIIEKNISLHNLRHSIASHLLEQGISTEQVRLFLGHNQLETTQIYTHINQKQLRNIKT